MDLPGTLTVPDQITRCKEPYYQALHHADAKWKAGRLDVSEMEALIESLLSR